MPFVPLPLTGRLVLTYLLLALLSVGGLIVWMGVQLQAATFDQEEHNLEIQAQLVGNALRVGFGKEDTPPSANLATLVQAYAQESRVTANDIPARVTVVNNQLRILASSDPRVTAGREENHAEFQAARAGFEQHEIRWDEFANEERVFVAAPIRGEEDVVAFVQLSVPTAAMYSGIWKTWLGLVGVGGIILALTALVSVMLARGIARPVQTLTRVSQEIANGHLERRVTPEGPDEIAQLGRTFNQMTERLQELIAREKDFAANAAHELRSPLTSLRLRLELLQNSAHAPPGATNDYFRQMEREVAHLQRVVEQLLTLAGLDQGAHVPRTNFDPAPLLYDLADELSPQLQQAQVQLRVNIPDHLPPIHANAEQIRMAVRNLLENALKYTPAQGCVTLDSRVSKDFVEIAVSDTGIGIPADALPHIFDRFYRVDAARRNRVRGSGLGLALTRFVVEGNEGHVAVTSSEGQGSTFTLQLPRQRN